MSIRDRILASILALCLLAPALSLAASRNKNTVLVIPSRYTIVQFAFDIMALRSMDVVAYEDQPIPGAEGPSVHIWKPQQHEWAALDTEAFASGAAVSPSARRIVIVGKKEAVPSVFQEKPDWAKGLTSIPSLKIVDLVNGLNAKLKFTPKEWRWLAERHGLTLHDANEERRRHGRYGTKKSTKNKARKQPPTEIIPKAAEISIAEDPIPAIEKSIIDAPAPSEAPQSDLDEPVPGIDDIAPEDK